MVDKLDAEIVALLKENARMPISSIAEKLGIGRGTARQRISGLRKEGIIRRYTVDIDESRFNETHSAFILISFMPGLATQREVANRISSIPGIRELYLISGGWDMIARVSARSLEELGSIVIDRLRAVEGVNRTETCSIFSTVKRNG
jgi:DNA-binding Lrp family transcriptional regulator